MRRSLLQRQTFLIPLLLLQCTLLRGESPSLQHLENLTSQWIDLRGTLAGEQRQWRDQKAAWEREITLLEEQSQALQTELDRSTETISSVEEERAEMLARRDAAGRQLTEVDAVLQTVIRDIRILYTQVPASLASGWSAELQRFAEAQSRDLPRAQRAQRLVALLSALESLQNGFHSTRERIETEEGGRQVDVMYLGLARGFAVSPGNEWSAVGVPGDQGWIWTPGGVDPQEVRRLIQVHARQETATLATVPLQVEETP